METTTLRLEQNLIKSIEIFEHLELPNLQRLDLDYNLIKDFKPLSKLKAENLEVLYLHGHHNTSDCSSLLDCHFPKLHTLSFPSNISSQLRDEICEKFKL